MILTEKYMELQAKNYNLIKRRKFQETNMNVYSKPPSALSVVSINNIQLNPTLEVKTKPKTFLSSTSGISRSLQSAPARMSKRSMSSFDVFKREHIGIDSRVKSAYESEYRKLPDRLQLKPPENFKSFLESLKDKFVEQKLKNFPNYLKKKRKTKDSMTLDQLDKVLGTKNLKNNIFSIKIK